MIDKPKIEQAIRQILYAIGENPDREGLKETPSRVANMYEEIFSGLAANPEEHIKIFHEDCAEDMVIVKEIPFYSMCEHHLLPFYGTASIVYIPNKNGEILGLSKIARIVDTIAKKPQLQEKLSSEVANLIEKALKPDGLCVVIEAQHLCMTMRGIKKPGSKTVTLTSRGAFKTDFNLRQQALSLISLGKGN